MSDIKVDVSVDVAYDELGPSKVMQYNLRVGKGIRAFVVVDNTALGPSVGGVRVSRGVTLAEVVRLARTMTLKCSIAGLPHGGGKSGIAADPGAADKEEYIRAFARAIREMSDYIPGPDMGSDELAMAWVQDEMGRAMGLPEEIGGIPLDKLGSTGFGLAECAEVACPYAGVKLKGARFVVQGFGSVGRAAARFITAKGAVVVAISDTKGCIYDPAGIDIDELIGVKEETGSVVNLKRGSVLPMERLFSLDCDILIPAAGADVINRGNVEAIKARLVLQGANIPATAEAEEMLASRGVLTVPDFVANAGGVITAAMEYAGRSEKETFDAISTKVKSNTIEVLERAKKENARPRQVAVALAKERVLKALRYRKGRIAS